MERYLTIIMILFSFNISHDQVRNTTNDFLCLTNEINPINGNVVKIEFNSQILYWDTINSKIIKDENYFKILNCKDNIISLAYFIVNEDIVCNFVCNKNTTLKKGDVAYIFLRENLLVFDGACLGIQFDSWDIDCQYSHGLLDYIESHRKQVFLQVIDCLNNQGVSPTK